MSDYIKREDAIEAFNPRQRRDWYTPWIVETLKDLPSEDVAPVRHGRWEEYGEIWWCSECGSETGLRWDYCPDCGAKMDGEEKNCDTCKHYDKWWDDIVCDGCTKAYSNWERKDNPSTGE